ncbi:MAG: calcium-binding EGF-like domain-containing protein [Chitinophagales bacterium]|nr:calcium-binding EGF-like domain-containing protein [Chitinophagales bacterium]MDW8428339.1 calcium-binding EGF-like domain-containing protein [Chitinophagales bacterium]
MKKVAFLGVMALSVLGLSTILLFNACEQDPCKDVVCLNGGTCEDGDCNCPIGYEGDDCGVRTADKYVGTWSAAEVCDSGIYNYVATISASSTEVTSILISNFGGFGSSVVVKGTIVDPNSFTIPSQAFGNVAFSGNGTLSADGLTINITYIASDGTTSDNCQATYTKQ